MFQNHRSTFRHDDFVSCQSVFVTSIRSSLRRTLRQIRSQPALVSGHGEQTPRLRGDVDPSYAQNPMHCDLRENPDPPRERRQPSNCDSFSGSTNRLFGFTNRLSGFKCYTAWASADLPAVAKTVLFRGEKLEFFRRKKPRFFRAEKLGFLGH